MTGTAPTALWPRGVLAAVPTPFDRQGTLAAAALGPLLDDVAARGGHGVLLAGTTGEGPSLGYDERLALVRAAVAWRAARPAGAAPFAILCGSGQPAWPEAARATAGVLAAGADAAVVLPPYYFKGVSPTGLGDWFRRVVDGAADRLARPAADDAGDGPPPPTPRLRVLAYDIPRFTGVPLPTAVLRRLVDHYGPAGPVVGLKDSAGDLALTRERIAALPELAVLTGTDTHLAAALAAGGAGAITAVAALRVDLLRQVWDRAAPAAGRGDGGAAPAADRADGAAARSDVAIARSDVAAAQADLDAARAALDRWPAVPAVKAVLAARLGGDAWHVRPPLGDLTPAEAAAFAQAWTAVDTTRTPPRSER